MSRPRSAAQKLGLARWHRVLEKDADLRRHGRPAEAAAGGCPASARAVCLLGIRAAALVARGVALAYAAVVVQLLRTLARLHLKNARLGGVRVHSHLSYLLRTTAYVLARSYVNVGNVMPPRHIPNTVVTEAQGVVGLRGGRETGAHGCVFLLPTGVCCRSQDFQSLWDDCGV